MADARQTLPEASEAGTNPRDDRGGDTSTRTKGERTRQRLLEIAIQRFGRHGYRSTSVSEITREAGLTQAAAYAYFPNKEALFREAVNADASALVGRVTREVDSLPVAMAVGAFLVRLIEEVPKHPLIFRVLSGKEPDAVSELRSLPAIRRAGSGLASRLEEAQRRGEVRTDVDPRDVAVGLQTIVLALAVASLQFGQGRGRETDGPGDEEGQPVRIADSDVVRGVAAVLDAVLRPADANGKG
ncbi:MAG: hypothetical protein KatS3mg008_0634 [Acidimicrobiales bacterium]|nr:MAG: hypothetical protein KatS3mg008_0634 [Acidimicrobiales bacterium]